MLKRRENESKLGHIKRIVYGKLVDKTIDEDYTELSEIVFGKSYSSDVARRMFYGARNLLEVLDEEEIENMTDSEQVEEINNKIKELEKEKVRFQDQKREYKALLRTDARFEHLKDEMLKAINDLNDNNPLDSEYVGKDFKSDIHAALILSDWHFGIKEKNIFNEISVDILKKRVSELVDYVITYCDINSVDTLHVELLGDLINGAIHIGTRVTSEEDAVSQAMHCAELICEALNKLAKYIPNVKVYSTIGNHGRVFANKKEQAFEIENFERLIPWHIKGRVGENVELVESLIEDDEILVIKFLNETIFAVHGHNDKVASMITNLSKMLKVFPTEAHMGHYHAFKEFDEYDMTTTVNGTLSGTDAYAKGIRKSSKPMQTLMIYNEKGRVCTYKLKF